MKNLKKIRTRALVIAAALLVSITGCDTTGLEDSIDNFALVIGLDPINTGSTVLLTDAETGELINATVTVTFDGENGDDVIDMYSDPIADVEINDGILNFAISNDVVPTSSSPAQVKLRLEADGYLPATKTVSLTEVGFDDFSFAMVNENNKPQSFKTVGATGTTASDGSTTAAIVINSNTGASGSDSTGIEIPEGTIFTDADGNPLTGNLSVEMSNFDLSDPIAVQNLPIDLEELDENSENAPTVLAISFLSVNNSQGKVATKIKKVVGQDSLSFNFSFSVNSQNYPFGESPWFSVFNTESDSKFNKILGDDIKLETKSENISVVVPTSDFSVSNNNHIGVVRIDLSGITSKTYSNLVIVGNGYEGTLKYTVNSKGRSEKGSAIISSTPVQKDIVFNRISESFSIDITSPLETTLTYPSLPDGDTFTITLPQKPADVIDSQVNVVLRCTDPDERASINGIPQSSLVYRKAGSTDKWKVLPKIDWNYNEEEQVLTGGTVTVKSVEQGGDYNFKLSFDGNTENKIININGTTVEVILSDEIDSICN